MPKETEALTPMKRLASNTTTTDLTWQMPAPWRLLRLLPNFSHIESTVLPYFPATTPLQNLTISSRCGFASVDVGNPITVDDERRKIELRYELAQEVWGYI